MKSIHRKIIRLQAAAVRKSFDLFKIQHSYFTLSTTADTTQNAEFDRILRDNNRIFGPMKAMIPGVSDARLAKICRGFLNNDQIKAGLGGHRQLWFDSGTFEVKLTAALFLAAQGWYPKFARLVVGTPISGLTKTASCYARVNGPTSRILKLVGEMKTLDFVNVWAKSVNIQGDKQLIFRAGQLLEIRFSDAAHEQEDYL